MNKNEHVPDWDGKSEPLRLYVRRVRLFQSNTNMPKWRQAGRLLERLKGDAFDKTEQLDPEKLKTDTGVEALLEYLRN